MKLKMTIKSMIVRKMKQGDEGFGPMLFGIFIYIDKQPKYI